MNKETTQSNKIHFRLGIQPTNKLNLIGNKYGKLVVLKLATSKTKWQTCYECVCECGNKVIVASSNLQSGNSRTCGCKRKEKKYESYEVTLRKVLSMRKSSAVKARGLTWTISIELGLSLLRKPCFYCGTEPYNKMSSVIHKDHCYGGIDRINNNKGYEPDNVRPCCRTCNSAKGTMSSEDFTDWCQKLLNKQWWIAK